MVPSPSSDEETTRNGPLAGIKVIDMSQAIAGPYAAMLLADLGANLIKIEPPWGDHVRTSLPKLEEDEAYGGYFQSVNRSKRSVCIDLTSESGQQALKDLVADSDIVLENFRGEGVTDKLGVSYSDLKEVREDIIYASITGFGHKQVMESPHSGKRTVDMVSQAMGGLMGVTGSEESGPTKVGPGIGDIFPGTLSVVGILAALAHRDRTGEGQLVDVAMVDSILSLCDTRMIHYSYTGENPDLPGNTHPYNFPYDVFDSADGPVVIAAINDKMWKELCNAIKKPELANEYSTDENRKENQDVLYEEINDWTKEQSRHKIMEQLSDHMPVGPLYRAEGIFDDEHFESREMLVDVPHANTGKTAKIAGTPIKFSNTPAGIQHRAPLLGEHTRDALEEIGYDDDTIDSMFESGDILESE